MPIDEAAIASAAETRSLKQPGKGRILGQIARYSAFASWLSRDVASRYGRRVLWMASGNALGLALHAGAIWIAYFYGRALESGRVLQAFGWSVEPRVSLEFLASAAVAASTLMVLAAFLIMGARIAAFRLGLDYGEYCTRRAYVLASRLPSADSPYASEQFSRLLMHRIALDDAKSCGIVLRLLLLMSLPAGTLVVALIALLVIDPGLTGLILLLVVISLTPLYRLGIQGARARGAFLDQKRDNARERRLLNDRLALSPLSLEETDPGLARFFPRDASSSTALASEGQQVTLERAQFTARLVFGASLFLVLSVRGIAMLEHGGNWSALVVYLAALSFFAGSFAKVARLLTNVHRVYPAASRYSRFVADAERARTPAPRPVDGHVLAAPGFSREAGRLRLPRGSRAALVLAQPLDRYAIKPLMGALAATRGGAETPLGCSVYFATGRLSADGFTLRELTRPAQGYDREALLRDLEGLGVSAPQDAVPADFSSVLDEADAARLTPWHVFLVSVLAAARAGVPALALDAAALAQLSAPQRERLLGGLLADRLVLPAYPVADLSALGQHGECAGIVVDERRVLGWAPIEAFTQPGPALEEALERLRAQARATPVPVATEALQDPEEGL